MATKPAAPRKQAKATTKKAAARKPAVLSPWKVWTSQAAASMSELVEFISTRGTEGHLMAFCRAKGFAYSTVRAWIEADEERSAMYARAREDRADVIADEIVAIADEVEVENVMGPDGEVVDVKMDATAIARNRLRVDARKWVASKLKPRVYGEKQDVNVTATVTGGVSYTANIPARGGK